MNNLNGAAAQLGEPYDAFDGQLRLFMVPYNTFKMRIIYQRLEAAELGEEYDNAKRCYSLAVGALAKCELIVDVADLSAESKGFWIFCNDRKGAVLDDFERFIGCVEFESIITLTEAYNATRRKLPKAVEALHGGRPDPETDPLPTSAGGKRGKKKSSR